MDTEHEKSVEERSKEIVWNVYKIRSMKTSWIEWFVWFCSCRWLVWLPSIRDVFANYKYVGPYIEEDEEVEVEPKEEEEDVSRDGTRIHMVHKSFKSLVEQGMLEHGTIVVCKKHVDKQGVVRTAGKKYGVEYEGLVYSYTDFLKTVNGGVKGNPWKLLYTIDEDGGLLDSFETLWEESLRKKTKNA